MHFAFVRLQFHSLHPPRRFDPQNLSIKFAIFQPPIVASEIATHYKARIPLFYNTVVLVGSREIDGGYVTSGMPSTVHERQITMK